MRTKSKVVRRHSIDQSLEGNVYVGANTIHDLNGCPVSSMVVQGSIDDGCLLDSDNGNWVGTLGGLGAFMDVDDGLHSVKINVHTPVSVRSSSGITINDPDSFYVTVTNTPHQI